MPPGGTGDCAAPKLLNYAFSNGLKPIAMGEFWYGKSPATAVRTHGHLYPSCTSKCGPLLSYMLKGLATSLEAWNGNPEAAIIYEDESIVAASKPSGMPSVPGLDGRISLQEYLEKEMQMDLFAVHRLDMDTSGVMVFAKTASSAVELMRQFEAHNVSKTYCARLCNTSSAIPGALAEKTVLPPWPQGEGPTKWEGLFSQPVLQELPEMGTIELPLAADYDERPRQKVDRSHGKYASTLYTVHGKNPDGTVDVAFYPITGRTHQLRVHSAHHLGLGSPILGDMLYGGQCTAFQDSADPSPKRLHLHASSLSFTHPTTGESLTFSSDIHKY
jgi:tRNA pseudouridine32 synthase/23S rRNA pseudouridine746 synthase